ncbi:hypothetical protein M231_05703 [Tremella mesenterica]|uniref:Uncharacterized protein n=1 Tax=Tremella mesenterica TaxID=5217 RepID=A0A4Q1BHI3_TREME|nr:hypothetical protein M231_05703 [Tremella mesenterica]
MPDAATSLITAFIETLESDQAMLSTDSTLNRLDEWLQGAHPVFRQTFCTERPETEEAREAWEVVDEAACQVWSLLLSFCPSVIIPLPRRGVAEQGSGRPIRLMDLRIPVKDNWNLLEEAEFLIAPEPQEE